jgi:hypothetical protein
MSTELQKRVREILQNVIHGSGMSVGGRRKRVVHRKKGGAKIYEHAGYGMMKKRKAPKRKGGARVGGKRKAARSGRSNPWIAHVKSYAKKHGLSYGEALKKARASY